MNFQKYIITEPVSNFRNLALDGLRGRWKAALVVAIVWYLALNLPVNLIYAITEITNAGTVFGEAIAQRIMNLSTPDQFNSPSLSSAAKAGIIISFAYSLLIGGPLTFGMSILYLRFRRRQVGGTNLLFSGFDCFSRMFIAYFVMNLFIFLWALLFIVPGIIAMYRYRLTFFIMADNPHIGPLEAINISKDLMHGNKGKLFLLDLSFIGWAFLVGFVIAILMQVTAVIYVLTFSAGMASAIPVTIINCIIFSVVAGFLYVYHGTATAAFYERSCGLLRLRQQIPPANLYNQGAIQGPDDQQ